MAAIIFLALGALMLYFAVEIGMRRRIAFLHDYHYQNTIERGGLYDEIFTRRIYRHI